jgi:hypothetical protein
MTHSIKPGNESMPIATSNPRVSSEVSRQEAAMAPENVSQPTDLPRQQHDAFAKQLGFDSYLDLFEASTPLPTSSPEGKWLMTSLRSGEWAVWNAADLKFAGRFINEDEARRAVKPEARRD